MTASRAFLHFRMRNRVGIFLSLFFSFFLGGCSVLPHTLDTTAVEKQDAISLFKTMISQQRECGCCVDAAVNVKLKSLFYAGTINGYLQAMTPSSLKFVGVNLLGQPLAVLVSDGEIFRYLSIPESKGYKGSVSGETFAKYAPDGFQPEQTFYWLVGRLSPGIIQIRDVSRDEEGLGYWFKMNYKQSDMMSLVLFDPQGLVIRRHLIVDDHDEIIMNIFYDDYTAEPCPLPGRITVKSLLHNSSIELEFMDWREDVSFSRDEFELRLPPGFSRVIVP